MEKTNDHQAWSDRLSDYVDGELAAAERRDMDVHLASCADCRALAEELRAVARRAGSLEDRPPASNLWPAIAARTGAPASRWTRRISFTLPQLAAAALALMVLSGGMVWMARLGGDRTDFPAIDAAPDARAVPAAFGGATYDEAIEDLQDRLNAGRDRLDPQTIEVLEENLTAIDRAIEQCQAALASDPVNLYLGERLAAAKKRKLGLLRRATALAGSL
jgi:hypothetical protein